MTGKNMPTARSLSSIKRLQMEFKSNSTESTKRREGVAIFYRPVSSSENNPDFITGINGE
jgi:hypothetical protein